MRAHLILRALVATIGQTHVKAWENVTIEKGLTASRVLLVRQKMIAYLHSENAAAKVRPETLQQADNTELDGVIASLERFHQQTHAAGEHLGLELPPGEGGLRREDNVGDGHATGRMMSHGGKQQEEGFEDGSAVGGDVGFDRPASFGD